MKKLHILAIVITALLVLALPSAYATTYAPLTVSIWTGPGVPSVADLTSAPATPANYTFTYDGLINFVNNNPQSGSNTFADFFGSSIAGLLSPLQEAALMHTTMSSPGFNVNTYMTIQGLYNGGGPVTLTSDDGSSLYVNNDTLNPLIFMPNPQSINSASATLPTGVNVPFELVYVEANGAPSDLIVSGMTPTPEPSSLLLLGSGLLGLALLSYRHVHAL